MAKLVKPRDLVDPVNTSLVNAPIVECAIQFSGDASDYVQWRRDMIEAADASMLGYYSTVMQKQLGVQLIDAVGHPVYVHDAYEPVTKSQAQRINSARDTIIAQSRRKLFALISRAIAPDVLTLLRDGNADLARDPDTLLAVVAKHAQGVHVESTGAALVARFFAMEWDGTAPTLTEQVDTNFSAIYEIRRTSEAVDNAAYQITDAVIMVKLLGTMPNRLRIHERVYLAIKDIPGLQVEMRRDAARADTDAAIGLKSFAVQTSQLKQLEEKINQLQTQLQQRDNGNGGSRNGHNNGNGNGNGGGGGGGGNRHTTEQLLDPDFQPGPRFKYWCTHHGHSTTHDTPGCYVVHPELAPSKRQ